MKNRKKLLNIVITLIIALVSTFGFSQVLANDNTSNTDTSSWGAEYWQANSGQWSVMDNCTGTSYSIVMDGEIISLDLQAGQTIAGTDKIKGYNSTGNDSFGVQDPAFQLETDGTLVLNQEDFAALAIAAGRADVAAKIESGAAFTAFTEQFIDINIPGKGTERWLATDAMTALLEYQLSDSYQEWGSIDFIKNVIEASFISFTELEQMDPYQLYLELLNNDPNFMKGYGIYRFEDGTIAILPEDPEAPKPDDPDTYEDTPSSNGRISITPGIAGGGYGSARGSIDNPKYNVIGGNPIPTSRTLTAEACTNIVGRVKQLGKYTVEYLPYTYTYVVNWREMDWYWEYEYDWEKVYDEDEDEWEWERVIVDSDYVYGTVASGAVSDTVEISASASFIKIRPDTDWFKRESVTIQTAGGVYHNVFGMDSGISYSYTKHNGSDLSRVRHYGDTKSFSVTAARDRGEDGHEMAQEKLDSLIASPSIWHFWSRPVTDTLSNNYTGSITSNGDITLGETCQSKTKTIPETPLNKSKDGGGGNGYPSSGTVNLQSLRLGGSTTHGFDVNPVQIHTPIYNKLTVEPEGKNQLLNKSLAQGYPIVTLGEKFTAKVQLNGPSHYYTHIDQNIEDLVKEVYIECEICGKTIPGKVHTCTVPVSKLDNKIYKIRSTVIAENSGPTGTANSSQNQPDDIYILKQEKGIYVAGKMYDLEVRTTDDPGWKFSPAEKLNKLPIGEKGDNNGNRAYKYGIKLGYRAYFDLKTLGQSIKDIKITPQIYYVTNTGEIVNNVEYYYRTSATEYKKLSANDISIIMTMRSTKGNVNNPDFESEILNYLSLPIPEAQNKDYTKKLNIGGLIGLDTMLLTRDNATLAKHNGKWHGESSRRWYGEVYMPASTIVAKAGASVADIARGIGVYKGGYILITFKPIKTTVNAADGTKVDYLQYSVAQNPDGNTNPPYVLLDEKASKNYVTLPNGIKIKNLPSDFQPQHAPIIVYDASLRANNDYESSGTH